jgi:hypothetical protein
VFVFGENVASMPPGYPGGENLWAVAFWLFVEEKASHFRLLPRRSLINSPQSTYIKQKITLVYIEKENTVGINPTV